MPTSIALATYAYTVYYINKYTLYVLQEFILTTNIIL